MIDFFVDALKRDEGLLTDLFNSFNLFYYYLWLGSTHKNNLFVIIINNNTL